MENQRNNMESSALGEFARLLIREMRDKAIQQCDGSLHPEAKSATAQRWKQLVPRAGLESVANTVIPDVADDTIFQLLQAIDGRQLKLLFTGSNGKTLYLPEDGLWELAGSYAGIPGWRSMFSKERYADDSFNPASPEDERMSDPALKEFAKLLVKEVRDEAIRACDRSFLPEARSAIAQRWKKMDPKKGLESVADILIPDVVDETLFQFLRAIDEGKLKLSFKASNGKTIDLLNDGLGRLAGWYASIPGWRTVYSKERWQ